MADFFNRKSIRLPGYDYTTSADYFITVVVHDRHTFLGRVDDDHVVLSGAGQMVDEVLGELSDRFQDLELIQYVIMPNHIHLLLGKYDDSHLSDVMRWLKSVTTNRYIHGVRESAWPPFDGRLWQRGYYEHIVRSQRALDYISRYIFENPMRWSADHLNPQCTESEQVMQTIIHLEQGHELL